jgi:hypothetical protein
VLRAPGHQLEVFPAHAIAKLAQRHAVEMKRFLDCGAAALRVSDMKIEL